MSKANCHLSVVFATALLGTQAVACSGSDIVLGARGGSLGPDQAGAVSAGEGASGATGSGATAGAAGDGTTVGGLSGTTGSAGMSGANAEAGAGAVAGAGVPMPSAGTGAITGGPNSRPSTGCGMDPVLTPDMTFQANGLSASYILDLPTGYDKYRAYPTIFAFRGVGVSTYDFRGYLNLPSVAGADAIVVYPDCPNAAAGWDAQRDIPWVNSLLAKLQSGNCIDQSRVFAVGHGAGALLVTALGCFRGDIIRGIAPLSSAPPPGMCTKTAVWLAQGNVDPMMLGLGKGNRDYWAGRNSCDVRMPVSVSPSPCVEYAGCDAGYPVRYCEFDGAAEVPTFTANGVWDFFKAL